MVDKYGLYSLKGHNESMPKQNLSIQFVSQVTGLNPHTLRAWEKRYGCITPSRDTSGRRQYSDSDVEKLRLLQDLVNRGNNISEISGLSLEALKEMHDRYATSPKAPAEGRPLDMHTSLQGLLMALHSYRLDIISHELEKVRNRVNARDFALSLVAPLLREIGDGVSNQTLNIAQEHALSSLLRFHVGQMLNDFIMSPVARSPFKVALATPPDERHEFGIMTAALLCGHYGARFYYLGPDLPAESLAEVSRQLGCDAVILGASRYASEAWPKQLKSYLEELRKKLDKNTVIWVGGSSSKQLDHQSSGVEFFPTFQLLDIKLAQITGKRGTL